MQITNLDSSQNIASMNRIVKILFLGLIISLKSCGDHATEMITEEQSSIILESIDAEHSGIRFNNLIRENKRLHSFIWNFIYQGAGVAIGDINNDGLPDVYFCGNMVSDKLYLNKGDFQFEDISVSSGIQDKLWSTGVNFVDINDDGFLDIYVVKNFFLLQRSVRTNKLFINNGDLSFTEKAAEFGLDDAGYGIQSHFFDADNDGDLDCYLVNQPMDQYAAMLAKTETRDTLPYSDKFFINEDGFFEDRTKALGFENRAYGLSAICADFNMDGWTDIYLCNDYGDGDNFYINKSGLVFKDEIKKRTGHCSFYSMGSDIDDINNDGLADFISLDMAFGDHYRSKTNMESMRPDYFQSLIEAGNQVQYPVNNLQLNRLDGQFSEIAHYAGVSHTDWSWSPLFVDLDQDASTDLLVSNGILRDLRNNDFLTRFRDQNQIRVNENNFSEVISSIPSTPVANKVYHNQGQLKFKDISKQAGFVQGTFSSGMAWGDLDGDGDADIVINNTNGIAGIYNNKSNNSNNYINIDIEGKPGNRRGLGTQIVVYSGGQSQLKTILSARAYMSASQDLAIYGMGNSSHADSIIIYWDNLEETVLRNVKANQTLKISFKTAKRENRKDRHKTNPLLKQAQLLDFTHLENAHDDYRGQVLLPHKVSQNGPFFSIADYNNDNLNDIFISNAKNSTAAIYIQSPDNQFLSREHSSRPGINESDQLESFPVDYEGDGDIDLLIVTGGSEIPTHESALKDLLWINDGTGHFTEEKFDIHSATDGQCITSLDIDNNGLQDIFIGGRGTPGSYGLSGKSRWLLNYKSGFEDRTEDLSPELGEYGMVTDAVSDDFDGDGNDDLILVGEWMTPTARILSEGKIVQKNIFSDGRERSGWYWSIEKADFDGDGDMDLLLGNHGENNKFHPSDENKLIMFAGDIDSNGDHDILLTKQSENQWIPVRGKECSTEEMPFISEKFKSYSNYALAAVDQIYTPEQLGGAVKSEVNDFAHYYLENQGNAKFIAHKLPPLCQLAPIKAFAIDDINKDGHLDFFYGGNHYPVEPETVRYDAGCLGLCLGDGKGGFKAIDTNRLGVKAGQDIRDLAIIDIGNSKYVLVANNNGSVESYEISTEEGFQ